ncbi:uncharacterized protein LOC133310412 isoform X2 [Gastrolobium bilobum]|nr:uncharacterized protein LOC133310412 isoform X2 [Gastrolobium bilobum]
MLAVGTSVKKLYSDIVQDLLPPSSCDLDEKVDSELPIDQYTDAGFCKKPFQVLKKRSAKADTKQTTEDSRIHQNVDNDAIHAASYDVTCETDASFMSSSRNSVKGSNFISHSRQYVGSRDIKSNLGFCKNQENKKMAATKIFDEITLAETDTCRTSQPSEISKENHNQNQNSAISFSEPASRLASVADCCNEIENASTKLFPNIPVLDKSAEEKQINTSSSSHVPFGESVGFSMDKTIQSDDCSDSMVVLSHPDQGHKAMQQDHLKLDETCVMVTGDELQSVPKAGGNLKTNKKKKRQGFSLSKKCSRKQEYEELAALHGNSEKVKGDCMENIDPTLVKDQKKLMLTSSISEPEWELL